MDELSPESQQQQHQQQGDEIQDSYQADVDECAACSALRCESRRLQALNISLTKRNDDVMDKLEFRGDREARQVTKELNDDLKRQNGALMSHIEQMQNHNDALSGLLQKNEDGQAAAQMHRAAELLVKGLANAEEEVQVLKASLINVEEQRDSYKNLLAKTNAEIAFAQAYAQMNMLEDPTDRNFAVRTATGGQQQQQQQRAPASDGDIARATPVSTGAASESSRTQGKGKQRSLRHVESSASSAVVPAGLSPASGSRAGGSASSSGVGAKGMEGFSGGGRGSEQVAREVPVETSSGVRISAPGAEGPRSSVATGASSSTGRRSGLDSSSNSGTVQGSAGVAERKSSIREAMDFSESDHGDRLASNAGGAVGDEAEDGGEDRPSSVYDSDEAPSMFF